MSFEDLKKHFDLTDRGDFWRYLQLRSSVGAVLQTICTDMQQMKDKQNGLESRGF